MAISTTQENNDTLLLRLPAQLKADLLRAAAINGRRIGAEVNMRLRASIDADPNDVPVAKVPQSQPYRVSEPGPQPGLADAELKMLDVFRSLPPSKQLALLSLFR